MELRMNDDGITVDLPVPDPSEVPAGCDVFAAFASGPDAADELERFLQAEFAPLVIHAIRSYPMGFDDRGLQATWVIAIVEPL